MRLHELMKLSIEVEEIAMLIRGDLVFCTGEKKKLILRDIEVIGERMTLLRDEMENLRESWKGEKKVEGSKGRGGEIAKEECCSWQLVDEVTNVWKCEACDYAWIGVREPWLSGVHICPGCGKKIAGYEKRKDQL